jgi:hypothetical protein
VDQSTFVTRTAARLNIDSNDPLYDTLDELADEALHYLEASAPEGWPWMRRTLTLTTTANVSEYTFATLGALATPDVTVSRILDCSVLYQTSYYFPMDLINPEDATRMYGSTATGIPETWYAEASTLYLYPTPNDALTLKVRVVANEASLGASTSTPVLPVVFHGAVIDTMMLLSYQSLLDDKRVALQEAKVERWVERMRRYGAQYSASPRITVRDPLWA